MNKKLSRTNRNYIIIGLCAILVIMGVGYAAFQSQLKISGTSNIASNFLVKITSITPNSIIGTAENKTEVTTYNDTSATFGVSLKSPGDSITYDITIVNQGTIDAVLKTITKTDASNSAILFETSGVNEGDELKVGETATMKVKVTYNPEVTSQPTLLDSTLKLTLDYAQKGTEVVPGTNNILLGGQEVEVVTSGDGLYADEYEAGRYIYKGANPNNYITFNNETWQILSVEEGKIKIVKDEVLPTRIWDSTDSNNWDRPSDIKTYLNGEYLDSITVNKEKIEPSTWSIGAVTSANSDLASQIAAENSKQSQVTSVGLITYLEYLRANTNMKQCGDWSLNNDNYETCRTTNWLFKGTSYWTLSPNSSRSDFVVQIYNDGRFASSSVSKITNEILPAITLNSNLTLTGSGTESDPFVIMS